MTNKEQQGFPPKRLHIRREDLNDLVAAGNGAAADIYVECSDSIFITHHEVYVPAALISEAVRVANEENKILCKQITECMEFLIWLKGSNYVDYEIEDRLIKLLEVLAASTEGVNSTTKETR